MESQREEDSPRVVRVQRAEGLLDVAGGERNLVARGGGQAGDRQVAAGDDWRGAGIEPSPLIRGGFERGPDSVVESIVNQRALALGDEEGEANGGGEEEDLLHVGG